MKDSLSKPKIPYLSNEEIIKEYPMRQLIRYNHRNRITDEDVAQHSFFVTIFCLKIMRSMDMLSPVVERDVLIKAALHDVPEIVTSDVPHDVKRKYPVISEALEAVEKEYYQENWDQYYDIMFGSDEKSPICMSLEDIIVKLADAYSVRQFCINEIELGNKSKAIMKIDDDAVSRINWLTIALNEAYEKYIEIMGE